MSIILKETGILEILIKTEEMIFIFNLEFKITM